VGKGEQMNTPYIITPEQLGLQRNALRIEVIPPMPRCVLRPKSDFSVIVRNRFHWRTDLLARVWSDFDYCVSDNCQRCPIFRKRAERARPFQDGVVRIDPTRGDYWMMNRKEQGWSSFGYPYKSLADIVTKWAVDIDANRKSDEHGMYHEFFVEAVQGLSES
jgi:hypothetical protein